MRYCRIEGPYRYRLDITLGVGRGTALWLMQNPSTADGQQDDPTSLKVAAFTRAWGMARAILCNRWAWRATDPKAVAAAHHNGYDVTGPLNEQQLQCALADADFVVCAWGNTPAWAKPFGYRALRVLDGQQLIALKVNKTGDPAHPLYQSTRVVPVDYVVPQ